MVVGLVVSDPKVEHDAALATKWVQTVGKDDGAR